jgi:hypothetical protein
MDQELLFSTPHGSRLYGLHHANSDHDRFDVYGWAKGKSKQRIFGSSDVTSTSIDRFLRSCDKGVPQYLEAMFSEQATVDRIPYIRENYHVNMTNVRDVYKRTIKAFWMEGTEEASLKLRRHAARLHINLESMENTGRFNPTLTPKEVQWVNEVAERATEYPFGGTDGTD